MSEKPLEDVRLTAVNDAEFFGVRAPCEIVYGSFLVQGHTTVEGARRAKKIQSTCLAVVALVRLVNVCLREDQDMGADGIPLNRGTVSFEEGLLT